MEKYPFPLSLEKGGKLTTETIGYHRWKRRDFEEAHAINDDDAINIPTTSTQMVIGEGRHNQQQPLDLPTDICVQEKPQTANKGR